MPISWGGFICYTTIVSLIALQLAPPFLQVFLKIHLLERLFQFTLSKISASPANISYLPPLFIIPLSTY